MESTPPTVESYAVALRAALAVLCDGAPPARFHEAHARAGALTPPQLDLLFDIGAHICEPAHTDYEARSRLVDRIRVELSSYRLGSKQMHQDDRRVPRFDPLAAPAGVAQTLAERGKRYGDFTDHARIAQNIQDAMRSTEGWGNLAPVHRQALTVIADKIARILSGDPNYADNWHDIQGYAKLVEDRLPLEKSNGSFP